MRKAAENAERIESLHYRVSGTVPEKGLLEAEASMRTEPAVMKMTMKASRKGANGRMEIRFVDGVMYVSGSAIDPEKLGGKSWFSADPAVWGRGATDNQSYWVLPRQLEGNPAAQSTILTAAKGVRRIGTETIDGTETTHFRGTVTGRGIGAARDAAPNKAARERQINNLDQFMMLRINGTLTVDLWIGDDDRTKQFRMRGDTRATRGGTDGQPLEFIDGDPLDLTFTFLDVDQPVTIEVPPSEDTADLAASEDEARTG
ncbi:hypothetical protein ACIP39_20445 [Streptomyces tibetensis]|uniref:hypothetical protein n=1 Tax=Streptomyces tibetensis TaxID=2382123 RepID=UPI003803C54B